MLTEERHRVIQGLLAADGRVLAGDLAARFGVSEDTARRDLRELAKLGACVRVYGGAMAPAPNPGSVTVRRRLFVDAKERLAAEAVELLSPGDTLFIDAGTTNLAIASAIPRGLRLTVATNSIAIAAALADHADIALIVLGGMFDAEGGGCVGGETLRAVGQIHADLFFIGACGVDALAGVTAFDCAEAEIKRAMAANSSALAIAATTDKLGTAAPFHVARATSIRHLIVEADAPENGLEPFVTQGTNVHRIAPPNGL